MQSESRSVMSYTLRSHGVLQARKLEWGTFSLLQGIFPTQGLNPGLPHCRQILYQLSHKGSPRILEWVAYPFSSRSSWPRNRTQVSCIADGFFTNWSKRTIQEKGLNDPDNHDCVVTHLEPEILEREVKWALGRLQPTKLVEVVQL